MPDPDYLARLVHKAIHAHLERRYCSAEAPMAMADKDSYSWGHPDSEVLESGLGGLVRCRCPHCGLEFTCFPRAH